MTYKEYVKQRITVRVDETEPFCPFSIGYCNDAYSEKCYGCEESRFAYETETPPYRNRCDSCNEVFLRVSVLRHNTSSRPVEVFLADKPSFCPLCGKKLA